MPDQITVVVAALDVASGLVRSAGSDVGAVGAHVGAPGAAQIADSAACIAFERAMRVWDEELAGLVAHLGSLADDLRSASAGYARTDGAVMARSDR